jgi:hypothetical protein
MTTQLVNPTPAQIRDLPVGATFLIEGVLWCNERETREEPSYPGSRTTRTAEIALIDIVTDAGTDFALQGKSVPLKYDDGVLENLRDVVAEVGETVSIEAQIVIGDNGTKETSIGYARAKLLVPAVFRQNAYDALRTSVANLTALLDVYVYDFDYAEARKCFARVRKLALTRAERASLQRVIIDMPVTERPVHDPGSTYSRDAIEKAFGVNLEELNAEDFLTFARQVLHGEIPNPEKPDRVDQSYLFRFLDAPPFTTAQFVELAFSTLQTRIARLELTGDSFEEYWDDYYLAEQCIAYLANIDDPTAVNALAWVIDYCLERGYFDNRLDGSEKVTCSRKFDSFLEKAVRSLFEYARYQKGKAPADFDSGRLLAWRNTLSAYPFMGHVADKLRASTLPLTSF